MDQNKMKKIAGIPVNENYDARSAEQAFNSISDGLVNLQDEIYGLTDPESRNAAVQKVKIISDSLSQLKQILKSNSLR